MLNRTRLGLPNKNILQLNLWGFKDRWINLMDLKPATTEMWSTGTDAQPLAQLKQDGLAQLQDLIVAMWFVETIS